MSRVGVPGADKWRCPVCTQVNSMEIQDCCPRCKEPVDDECKHKWRVTHKTSGRSPSCAAGGGGSSNIIPTTRTTNRRVAAKATNKSAIGGKSGSQLVGKRRGGAQVSKRDSIAGKPPKSTNKGAKQSPAKPPVSQKRTSSSTAPTHNHISQTRTTDRNSRPSRASLGRAPSSTTMKPPMPTKGKTTATQSTRAGSMSQKNTRSGSRGPSKSSLGLSGANVTSTAPKRTTKPSKWTQKQKQMGEKHLGYKASRSNVAKIVTSKLNHDTAAYRGKFDRPENKRGSNIATMADLTSKSGFQTSLSRKTKKGSNPHDEKVVPRARKRDDKAPSVIARLQQACSGQIMGSLKHTGKVQQVGYKDICGKKSKIML